MKHLLFISIAIAFAVTALPISAFALCGGGCDQGDCSQGSECCPGNVIDVGLTKGQEKIKNVLKKNMEKEIAELKATLQDIREELRELNATSYPDLEAIKEAKAEAEEVKQQIADAKEAFRQALMKILTPEQRKKLEKHWPKECCAGAGGCSSCGGDDCGSSGGRTV